MLYAVDEPPLDEVLERPECVTTPGGETGLKGAYFDNQELQGSPTLVRVDKHVEFKWGEGSYSPSGQSITSQLGGRDISYPRTFSRKTTE